MRGFTLIELMIVVAILGMLVVIDLAKYEIYTGRSQQTEPLHLAEGLKTAVAEAIQGGHDLASINGGSPGIPADIATDAGRYTKSLVVAGGTIVATMKGTGVSPCARDAVVSITPTYANADVPIQWSCTSTSICSPTTCQ